MISTFVFNGFFPCELMTILYIFSTKYTFQIKISPWMVNHDPLLYFKVIKSPLFGPRSFLRVSLRWLKIRIQRTETGFHLVKQALMSSMGQENFPLKRQVIYYPPSKSSRWSSTSKSAQIKVVFKAGRWNPYPWDYNNLEILAPWNVMLGCWMLAHNRPTWCTANPVISRLSTLMIVFFETDHGCSWFESFSGKFVCILRLEVMVGGNHAIIWHTGNRMVNLLATIHKTCSW